MPLYEYTCQECKKEFETLVFGDEVVECPECKSVKLEKHWSIPARPQAGNTALPMGCDPNTPPCGTGCRKLMARQA